MSIFLPDDLADRVRQHVTRGDYESPDAVMREALRLLDEHEEWRRDAREKIEEAFTSLERGEHVDGEVAMARIRERLEAVARERGEAL